MSLVGNAIKMAIILKSRGMMKITELAQELEVSERQIRKYRDDLEQAGIFIESKTGIFGGYQLVVNDLMGLDIRDDDLMIIEIINEQLRYNNDLYAKEFTDIVDKIRAHKKNIGEGDGYLGYFTVQPKSDSNNSLEKKKYKQIHEAYLFHKKIRMQYYSLSSGVKERVVHPYGLFHYKGDMYLVAYCELKDKFLDFKLCRIREYEILSEKFEVNPTFSWKKYSENTIGIYKDKEINLVLKVKHPFSVIISEKVWVENQEISNLENGDILFKARIKGYSEIKSWILSMGLQVEVIQPEQLRNDIKKEIDEMRHIYY